MHEIDVIASNGEINKHLVWLNVTPKGIYYELALRDEYHMSLHPDGTMRADTNWAKPRDPIAQHQPFNTFKESIIITSYRFPKDITKFESPIYEKQKSKKVVTIDTKLYSSNQFIICDIIIVEPKRQDLIDRMESRGRKIYVYKDYSPWIVISVYGINPYPVAVK